MAGSRSALTMADFSWLESPNPLSACLIRGSRRRGNNEGGAMAKLLHLLLDWEYPHWMMMAGAILVAVGFIGLAFHRNTHRPLPTCRSPGAPWCISRGCRGLWASRHLPFAFGFRFTRLR